MKSERKPPKHVSLLYPTSGIKGILARITGQPTKLVDCDFGVFNRADYSSFYTGAKRVITSVGNYVRDDFCSDTVTRLGGGGEEIRPYLKLRYDLETPEQRSQRELSEKLERERRAAQ